MLVNSYIRLDFVFQGKQCTAAKGERFGQKTVEGKDESVIN